MGFLLEFKEGVWGAVYNTPPTQNWDYSIIKLNQPIIDNFTAYNKEGTISHEMGHVMGLNDDNSITNHIMCQLNFYRSVNSPQADDVNGINSLY